MKEHPHHIRQIIAQAAARMMAEEGVFDYGYAKKKAGRQLGVTDGSMLPSNAEIEEEVRLYHEIFHADEQPQNLLDLRKTPLATMRLFERFNPHLTGSVLDGTAGKFAQTDLHLFADSAKEVELFLLNQQIPFQSSEKSYRLSDRPSKDKKEKVRKTVPVFTLETEHGLIKLSVFDVDDLRIAPKAAVNNTSMHRANAQELAALIG